jgi:hypothetical protein
MVQVTGVQVCAFASQVHPRAGTRPLRSHAVTYFRQMTATTPGSDPYPCVGKHGTVVDYATALVWHEVLKPGDLLIIDAEAAGTGAARYGYRTLLLRDRPDVAIL